MSDRCRVLLISDSALPRHDGIATSLRTLTQVLYDLGFPATLIGAAALQECYPRATVISVPAITTYHGYPIARPAIRSLWRAIKRADVIHVHTLGTLGAAGLILAKIQHRPAMLSVHTDFDVYAVHYPIIRSIGRVLASIMSAPKTKVETLYIIVRAASYFANVLVLPSAELGRRLPMCPGEIPLLIIPNEVSPTSIKDYQASDDNGNYKGNDILYVGRMATEKSVDYLLRCFAECLADRGDGSRLTLVGDGPQFTYLKRYAKALGLSDEHVHWLGAVSNDEVLRLMSASRVLAFPSLSDVDPMVLAEAAAVSLPAVVRDPRLARVRPSAYILLAENCQTYGEALATARMGGESTSAELSMLRATERWRSAYRLAASATRHGVSAHVVCN